VGPALGVNGSRYLAAGRLTAGEPWWPAAQRGLRPAALGAPRGDRPDDSL